MVEDRGSVDALNIYFNYSEGFNPNLNVRDADGNPLTTPQVMDQYEIGIKGEFLNHALGASLAIYDSEVTNIPVSLNFLGELATQVPHWKESARSRELNSSSLANLDPA